MTLRPSSWEGWIVPNSEAVISEMMMACSRGKRKARCAVPKRFGMQASAQWQQKPRTPHARCGQLLCMAKQRQLHRT